MSRRLVALSLAGPVLPLKEQLDRPAIAVISLDQLKGTLSHVPFEDGGAEQVGEGQSE